MGQPNAALLFLCKEGEKMIFIDNVEQLIDYVFDIYGVSEKEDIVIILKNENIAEALGYLLGEYGLDVKGLEYDVQLSEYHGITIGGDMTVFVDPIMRNDNYISFGDGCAYFFIDEDVPSAFQIRQDIDEDELEIFSFDDDRFEQPCPNCYDCVDSCMCECEEEMSDDAATLYQVIVETVREEIARVFKVAKRKG